MLTIDRLKYFREAALLEHVGQAAKNLNVSPSVISSAIKILEREFNCSLFSNQKNRIKLNENGLALLKRTDVLLQDIDKLYSDMAGPFSKIKGHFKIGAGPFLMKELLLDSFLKVKKENPQISGEFLSIDTGMAISYILSGFIDFALVFRSIRHQDLEEKVLYSGVFNFVVKKGHPILKMPVTQRIKELNFLDSITFKTTVGPNYCENHPAFNKLGITPKHTFFYDNNDTSIHLLKKTNAWAFLPDIVAKKYSAQVSIVNLPQKFDAPLTISLIKSKNRIESSMFNKLSNYLISKLDQY